MDQEPFAIKQQSSATISNPQPHQPPSTINKLHHAKSATTNNQKPFTEQET
jgi:hypothetical protein